MTYNYVFNIGLNRSGTTSLTEALNILGIPSLHFSINEAWWSPDKSNEIESVIYNNIKRRKRLLHTLDHRYQGFSDFNGEHYYQELYTQYPNSKFIFTIRDPEDWLRSIIKVERFQERFLKNSIEEYKTFKRKLNHYYNKRNEILNFFQDKPEQFLQMNICKGEGWEVLCNFLDKEIPEVPFPYVNQLEKIFDN